MKSQTKEGDGETALGTNTAVLLMTMAANALFSLGLPHDLRHTYATALYDAGVDIKSAQYYLGHDDVNMTINLYTHLSKIKENEARSSLVNYLDKWLDKHLLPVKN